MKRNFQIENLNEQRAGSLHTTAQKQIWGHKKNNNFLFKKPKTTQKKYIIINYTMCNNIMVSIYVHLVKLLIFRVVIVN